MARERRSSFFGDLIKYALVLAIVGGIVYYFVGDKIRRIRDVKGIDISENYSVADSDDKLQGPINFNMKVYTSGNPGYFWRVYFKHLPEKEKDPAKYRLQFAVKFNRKINKSNRSDADGTSHHYSPGSLQVDLRIKQELFDKTVYREKYDRELKPVVVRHAGEAVSEQKKQETFADEEERIIKYELAPWLSIAAIELMKERDELVDQYLPTITDAVGHSNKVVSDAALKALQEMKPKDAEVITTARKQLTDRLAKLTDDRIKDNVKKAREFLDKRLERAKKRQESEKPKDAKTEEKPPDQPAPKDTGKDEDIEAR